MDSYQAGSRSKIFILGGILVLLIAIAGYWWFTNYHETVSNLSSGVTLTAAPSGKVVSGFPKDLIPEEEIRSAESYRLDYAENGLSQPVLNYVSQKSYADNISAFKARLAEQGWEVSHEADPGTQGTTFFYAQKEGMAVNITLTSADDGGTNVVIAYAQLGE